MKTTRFTRKSFEVEAVRVTHENFEEVRAWCDGEEHGSEHGRYFQIDIKTQVSQRARRAHIGDWVLRSGTGFRVYTNNAFRDFFIPVRSGVEILNGHLRRPDRFPGEPEEMAEDLGFRRDMLKSQEPDLMKPKPPARPLKVVRTAKNTGQQVGFGKA